MKNVLLHIICVCCLIICLLNVSLVIFVIANLNTSEIINTTTTSNNEIVNAINSITLQMSKKNYSQYIIPWILSTITSFIAFIGSYTVTQVSDRKKFNRQCTFDYIKSANLFLRDINLLYTKMACMMRIVEYFEARIKASITPNLDCNKDFNTFIITAIKLNPIIKGFTALPNYNDSDLNKIDEWNSYFKEFNGIQLIIDIGTNFESNVCQHYYILDKRIIESHDYLMNELRKYSSNQLIGFYPMKFKEEVIKHIQLTNDILMNK